MPTNHANIGQALHDRTGRLENYYGGTRINALLHDRTGRLEK